MSDIDAAFATALTEVEELPERPGNDDLLKLYALYKQASEGDVSGERPGLPDFTGMAKFDAWAALKGMSAESAMSDYVALVERLEAEQAG